MKYEITEWPLHYLDGVVVAEKRAITHDSSVSFDVFDADQWPGFHEEGAAMALRLVHCVNLYEKLVEALELAEAAMNYMGAELDEIGATATPEALKVTAPAFDAVRAALAHARGER